nr:MAG TPA: baseplate assembly protein [Caudoviricetes sp.]DAQ10775.1 MAG TPA: baseplate assembly protein [Caudoviricetes sp.]DAX93543.1 MAG TPA: baseplate assembly protein [Caudoviricetes sp.]
MITANRAVISRIWKSKWLNILQKKVNTMMRQPSHNFAATLQFGTVAAVDASRHALRVTLPALENLQTDWLPMITPAALGNQFYSLPDVGTLVVCLLDAQGESGAVLGAIYNDADPTPASNAELHVLQYRNGTRIEHDRSTGDVRVTTSGKVLVQASEVTLDAPQTTTTGNLLVQGSLTYQGGMTGSGGKGAAAQINGNIRITGDVEAGGNIDAGGEITGTKVNER